jgi:GAF domain-containing protein
MSSSPSPTPQAVAAAFVEIADAGAAVPGGPEILDLLCNHCVGLFDLTATVIVLADQRDHLQVAAATVDHGRWVEQVGTGPYTPFAECVRLDGPVILSTSPAGQSSWPEFASRAHEHGITSVHLLPMHSDGTAVGAIGLLNAQPAALTAEEVDLADALLDAAAAALAQRQALDLAQVRIDQLQHALDSRVVIEQAKGALATRGSIDLARAFAALRGYARDHQMRLHQLASQVIGDQSLADQVLNHDTG